MEVITVRVQERTSREIAHLAKELDKSRAEVIRELMSRAVRQEHAEVLLRKYAKREITLRTLAAELAIPLWKAHELAERAPLPYERVDLERDLRLIGEI